MSRHARDLVAEKGDDTPIEWVHRDTRFGEKLATPDTSIADLIGEVDPIKVAEGRYLSDELTLHYGLVPRTNRGIFAINELPDLAERIQVGLLNVLEERDVQIRGYKIRLPLDVMLVASANPEDYTNRGRIITPLKDRFGAQIRTHYPLDVETELRVVDQEARPPSTPSGLRVQVPPFMAEIVGTLSHLARQSPNVNQRSGVSVRLSIANYETLVANAARRALRLGEKDVVPRVSDLEALASSTSGKVEIETLEEGRDGQVVDRLLKQATLTVFKAHCPMEQFRDVVLAFDEGTVVHAGDDVPSSAYTEVLGRMPGPAVVGHGPGRQRDAGRRGQRHRVRARGPAPVQAAQQGGCGRPGHLPGALGRRATYGRARGRQAPGRSTIVRGRQGAGRPTVGRGGARRRAARRLTTSRRYEPVAVSARGLHASRASRLARSRMDWRDRSERQGPLRDSLRFVSSLGPCGPVP